ncbi:conserved hypothetical protein [Hyphomicrobiales bacterium]|nr:conserved hypothetical protein [Hyphomicrobiales bacterium]CAH1673427.1 conserved hypothetical protein [Hyphomicrobiales bacterium]
MTSSADFTLLERAVLAAISDQYPLHRTLLERQVAHAAVASRRNSGAGFFVDITVDKDATPPVDCGRVLGNVWATISGFLDPVGFLLFVDGSGYIDCLEGAAIRDQTADIDFSSVTFEIINDATSTSGGPGVRLRRE